MWATGLRNTQALLWLPDGSLLGTDHGPSGMPHEGGRTGNDELNLLQPGRDYGWPNIIGREEASGVVSPVWSWASTVAPGGLTGLLSPSGRWTGDILVSGLSGSLELLSLTESDGRWHVTGHTNVVTQGRFGRLRSLLAADDGTFSLTTSNRDARGQPRPGDDLLLRITLTR